MKIAHIYIAAAALGLLSGCSQKATPQSVEWYEKNTAEREAQLRSCAAGTVKDDVGLKNCANAESAVVRSQTKRDPVQFK